MIIDYQIEKFSPKENSKAIHYYNEIIIDEGCRDFTNATQIKLSICQFGGCFFDLYNSIRLDNHYEKKYFLCRGSVYCHG